MKTVSLTKNGICAACAVVLFAVSSFFNAADNSSAVSVELLPSPASINSSLSRVVSDQNGSIYLSWVEEKDDVASLVYAKLAGNSWIDLSEISRGEDWFVNWADFPMLMVNGENRTAHWLRMSAEGTYDYNIEASFFDSMHDSWSDAKVIHSDGVSAEHGFVSMLPLSEQRTMITWLDGRNTKLADEYGQMTLRAGIFEAAGNTVNEWELDHRVCDCCQTSSAMTAEGPIVVYRDRSENEIRDIAVTRYSVGQWTAPKTVHEDGWQINGCPVNGPSIAAQSELVAVAWFTAKDDEPKVQLALSSDSGNNFSSPIEVAHTTTIGRVDTAILESGDIVVSWVDAGMEDAAIVLSRYSSQGALLSQNEITRTSPSRRSGFPIIESVDETVYLTWTELTDTSQVKIARVTFD